VGPQLRARQPSRTSQFAVGHDSADSAIHVDDDAVVRYVGESTTGRKVTAVSVHVDVLGPERSNDPGPHRWPNLDQNGRGQEVRLGRGRLVPRPGSCGGSAATLCTGIAYVCVEGRSSFLTVAGVLGAALAAVALYLLIKGWSSGGNDPGRACLPLRRRGAWWEESPQ
jgi:hypothetical protein